MLVLITLFCSFFAGVLTGEDVILPDFSTSIGNASLSHRTALLDNNNSAM